MISDLTNLFSIPETEIYNCSGLYLGQGSKAGPTTFVFYDDICYSSGEYNDPYFSLYHIQEWGIIMAASYNAMEIGILGEFNQF